MISIVYNCDRRENGTAFLARVALQESLGLKDRVVLDNQLKGFSESELYIHVDDGREDLQWECPKPNAYWAIDTHLGYEYRLEKARQFDNIFVAQKECAARMIKDGIKNVEWLPLACSPIANPTKEELLDDTPEQVAAFGGPSVLTEQHSVVFCGHIESRSEDGFNDRVEYLDHLFREIPSCWLSHQLFFEEMAIRYIRGRLGFNISVKSDLNMRFFEVMSIGTALLTDSAAVGWDDIGYEDGKHFIGYTDMDDMVHKAKWALRNPVERNAIALEGHQFTRDNHTYAHRMAHILDVAGIDF